MKKTSSIKSIIQSIYKQRNNGGELQINFTRIGNCFPLPINVFFPYDACYADLILNSPKVTTPIRFERWLIKTVTRTKYKDYLVTDPRYTFDFSTLGLQTVSHLFNVALRSTGTRSWLEPLQDLIITQKEAKNKNKHNFIINNDNLEWV